MTALLALAVVVPLAIAGVLFAFAIHGRARNVILVLGLTLHWVTAVAILAHTRTGSVLRMDVAGWDETAAIRLSADALTGLMLVLTSTVALIVCPFALRSGRAGKPYVVPLVFVLMAGVSWTLVTADLFNLYVGIEVMLLPSYGIMISSSRGQGRLMQVTSTRIYVTLNLLTSSIILMGVAAVYAGSGRLSYAGLSGAGLDQPLTKVGAALILFALATKAALVPMHGWLARAYPHMPATVTALFSGLQTKVAVYALYRLHSVFFGGQPVWGGIALVVVCMTMVIGVLGALGAREARAAIALLLVEDAGFVLLGLAVHTRLSMAAALFFMVASVFAKLSLFLSTGAIEIVYGRRLLGELQDLVKRERFLAMGFLLAALSLSGLPPMGGFVAKFGMVSSLFRSHAWLAGAVALLTSLLTLMTIFRVWSSMFMARDEEFSREPGRVAKVLAIPAWVAVGICLVLGIWAEPVLQVTDLAARQLLDPVHHGGGVR